MARKKDNSPKIIVIGVLVIIAVFYFGIISTDDLGIEFQKTDDINDGTFFNTGTAFELPFLDISNGSVTCEYISELYAFRNGSWDLVDSKDNIFFTTADIQSHSNQQVITKFRVDNFVKCDIPNAGVKSLGVNGYTSYLLTTGTPGQSDFEILQGSTPITVPTTLLDDNQKEKISSIVFTADSVEDRIAVNSIGSGILRVQALHGGTYTMLLDNNDRKLTEIVDNLNSEVRHSVFVTADAEPTGEQCTDGTIRLICPGDQSRRGEPISIDSVSQVQSGKVISNGGTLDLDGGHQVKIKATMNDYRTSDGLPKIQISGTQSGMVNLLPVPSSGTNQKFEINVLLKRNAIGDYTFTLSHPLRDMTKTFSFTTGDSSPPEPVQCPAGTSYDSVSKTCKPDQMSSDPTPTPPIPPTTPGAEACQDGTFRLVCPENLPPAGPTPETCPIGQLPIPSQDGTSLDCLGISDLQDLVSSGTLWWILGGFVVLIIVIAILKSAFSNRNPYR